MSFLGELTLVVGNFVGYGISHKIVLVFVGYGVSRPKKETIFVLGGGTLWRSVDFLFGRNSLFEAANFMSHVDLFAHSRDPPRPKGQYVSDFSDFLSFV